MRNQMYADLHLHTNFSDGTYSPEELVLQGAAHGLNALALTDHDTVEGCLHARAACETAGIEFIAGTELTAQQDENELHILAYLVDLENPRFRQEISRFQSVRQNRIREMISRLNALNVPLTADEVFALANYAGTPASAVLRDTTAGGHLGLFMSHEALHNHWPALLAAVHEHSV